MTVLYALEKLSNAVDSLATGRGRIQERLFNAYLSFHTIQADDLPEALRPDLEWINDRLDREQASGNEGTVRATLNVMTDDDAVEVAQRILALEAEIETAVNDSDES